MHYQNIISTYEMDIEKCTLCWPSKVAHLIDVGTRGGGALGARAPLWFMEGGAQGVPNHRALLYKNSVQVCISYLALIKCTL